MLIVRTGSNTQKYC